MYSRNGILGLAVVSMFALSVLLAPASLRGEEPVVDEKAAADVEKPEAQTVTGHVVDLHHYMISGKLHATGGGDKDLLSFFAPEAPIALVVEDEGLVDKLTPGTSTYLIMFDPKDSATRDVYAQARKMLGESVAVTGRLHKRDGISAIELIGVHTIEQAAEADLEGGE